MTSSNDTRNPKRSIVEDSFEKSCARKREKTSKKGRMPSPGTQQAALHHNNKTVAEGKRRQADATLATKPPPTHSPGTSPESSPLFSG